MMYVMSWSGIPREPRIAVSIMNPPFGRPDEPIHDKIVVALEKRSSIFY